MKTCTFQDVSPCKWVEVCQCYEEILVTFYCNTWHYIPKDSSLNTWQFRDPISVTEEIGLHFRYPLHINNRLKLHC